MLSGEYWALHVASHALHVKSSRDGSDLICRAAAAEEREEARESPYHTTPTASCALAASFAAWDKCCHLCLRPRAASSIYSMGATERAMGVRTVFSLVVAPDDDAADSEEDNAAERP